MMNVGRVVAGAMLMIGLAGCASARIDSSAPFFPTSRPVASSPPPLANPAIDLAIPPASFHGAIARPDPQLTPGVIAVTDVTAVCASPRQAHVAFTTAEEQASFIAYKIPWPAEKLKYRLGYLIPLDLGGAAVAANRWPITTHGLSLHQFSNLDARLRLAVCQGAVSLSDVQHGLVSDWYALWLRFGN
jgi:hypothetical protein